MPQGRRGGGEEIDSEKGEREIELKTRMGKIARTNIFANLFFSLRTNIMGGLSTRRDQRPGLCLVPQAYLGPAAGNSSGVVR